MDNISITKILHASTFILAMIRFHPKDNATYTILSILSEYFKIDIKLWDYKKFINQIEPTNFFEHFNTLENVILINYKEMASDNIKEIIKYNSLISKICYKGCTLYSESKFEQLAELIDLLHGLPEALIIKKRWNPKKIWKTYFNPYRKNWDKHFMKDEQKLLLRLY